MTSPFKSPGGPAGKYSASKIAERREETYELHFVRGLSVAAIAAIQTVSANTVRNDIAAIKEYLADGMRKADIVEEVAVQGSYYDQIRRDAMVEFSRTDDVKAKAGFLLMALKATNQQSNFFINVGYFPSKKQQIDLEVRQEITAADVGDEELAEVVNDPVQRTQVLSFLERLQASNKAGLLTVDVDGKSKPIETDQEEGSG
jgi:DNA-binding CsgD family transcriptional regulator